MYTVHFFTDCYRSRSGSPRDRRGVSTPSKLSKSIDEGDTNKSSAMLNGLKLDEEGLFLFSEFFNIL